MAGEVIRCEKWTRQADGTYQCAQTGGVRCGCKSSITPLRSIDGILSKDQRDDRRAYIEDVKKIIAEGDRAALVLGAGISKNAGMPAWSGLISKMMGYAVQYDLLNRGGSGVTEDPDEKKRLLELTESLMKGDLELLGKVNTLESAEYVAQLFDIRAPDPRLSHTLEGRAISAMARQIVNNSLPPRELLLKEKTGLLDELRKHGDPAGMTAAETVRQLGARKVAESDSMCAVAYLLSAEGGIRRAMTYNYDPLVQEYMMELYGTKSGELLTHPGAWGRGGPGEKARELYHVHGFVPGERHLARGDGGVFPGESGPIILSEDSYYRIEQEEAYNWSSSIQSYFLNRYQCIFVGFSAEDYNFRRILRQIGERKSDDRPHYLILSVGRWISDIYEEVCRALIGQAGVRASEADAERISKDAVLLLRYVLQCRAAYWRRFNIRPIWVTVKEIPELLAELVSD